MELYRKDEVVARAEHLKNHYGYDALSAMNIAIQELQLQDKKESGETYEYND
ncbi:hypothetical protein [Romboutsia sp. 1001713B170131_170501_G6]|uniref:hypothetical protein n=1 Tax=Romboutsia sp. 1001713B170131_170501_G6 TaxID=2787108 RepID=UPI0018AB55E6|nr:hypothetical protein [Romboutsia sp. 1001713B170131_170501_G6]